MSALPELAFESTRTLTQEEFAAWVAARCEKKDVYERNGVREYWLIDPRPRTLLVYTRQGDRFDTGRTFAEGQPFSSAVLPGLAFDVASVL